MVKSQVKVIGLLMFVAYFRSAYYQEDVYCKRGEGRVLRTVAYTGRLRPKVVPYSGFRYIKG